MKRTCGTGVGADGFLKRLLLWTFMPLGVVALTVVLIVFNMWRRHVNITSQSILEHVLPVVLRIAFLIYPIVTNVAFEAFSCFEFEDGRSWLIADLEIECHTDRHKNAKAFAWIAIVVYPIGCWLVTLAAAAILLAAAWRRPAAGKWPCGGPAAIVAAMKEHKGNPEIQAAGCRAAGAIPY